ncbi:MAG: hypothetical protein A2X13_08420 [Bacteroidetes bacterium GWC2_33_15]|nr:MAG: hypothetical protein A2X10_10250 [Bacteroidetes bacterium GWA2_33_15]OFX51477.1 MAG: hypothetical protein A2X13_08420 [Bacteroidetes bacterium GWC2_33_15]OFX65776.1 MAG: hypothetical protein A2X15_13355 [Bacteroidetes bacterium GWB2_32_14]OFX69505.1 MAG: hypothetical protein A2X14_10000 [Bacteroidetes bacterium GWD2_33_33]HAN17764.1 hypothetical protein [Bacteroidales bacterium]
MDKLFTLDNKGYIKSRESFDIEFKQNFQLGDNLIKYIKSLIGMANNKGGKIVFGIQDKPHIPVGMTNNKFNEADPVTIDKTIRECFSQELIWSSSIYRFNDKDFAVLSVEEAELKPIICKKNKANILREGAIYYRYRGETKEIEYPELQKIIDKEREKEKLLWMNHIQQISTIGPKNVQLLDTYKGEISVGSGRILIDKNVLEKIKFVKEGNFVEKDGAPTLKLVGNITGIVDIENTIPTDKLFPLFTKDLQERLNINSHDIKCILWKLNIKGNQKYHSETKTGKNSNWVNKYSESLLPVLKRIINTKPDFLKTCRKDYKEQVLDKKK